ncbi:BgTH12-07874 [Blumeria graminis f. sp. triticale]|uniref:Protein-lysine N-methyltransferase EFM4 n=3 Tax=Blumeria graminis TaxID=34373 RepID=A0A061HN96_BLUGR|nr:S-adenosylmethionine-dependent methyltransferase of the seven beta-strand family [Blumeria graminis f. sp. tritici 96224]CAD6499362.1 BgTH12-07874 [Blumeria graminis f. sp. triticale]VCU39503.1 Bgt-1144 [Blumeria graminis f. sp. tritici]
MNPPAQVTLTDLEPSPLGTKHYWDDLYSKEIKNFEQNCGDEGTIWFDDSAAEEKVLEFIEDFVIDSHALGTNINRDNCSFLDLGTGNGHLLFSLRAGDDRFEGWCGRMLGVDYSEKSIEFAKRIAQGRNLRDVEFCRWDVMQDKADGVVLDEISAEGWDVVLDKGTFDAISLSADQCSPGQRNYKYYRTQVLPLIRKGGVLLITSCNWTEDELKLLLDGPGLAMVSTIKYDNFSFGGKKGQTVSSVCFRKTSSP